MDKNQNQIENLKSENINQNLLDIKNYKSNSANEINNIIIIKELINSLKEKINTYEKQIKKLIDDKVKLQMDMNSIILQNLSLKKKNNSLKNNENSKEDDSLNLNNLNINFNPIDFNINENNQEKIILSSMIEINKKLVEQNKELKSQIDIFKSNIENYKKKMMEIKENKTANQKCKFCEEKKLELSKMASEKEEIFDSIKSLRKQLDELKLNEKIKKEKKKKQRTEKNESLPSIEQYFIVNNKFQLVDSNKNLWHMKKCMKFQEFKKKYEQANLSPDDLLKEFVESYEIKIDDDNMEENEYIEALNYTERSQEYEKKKYENKYMPPLPNMNSGANKKRNNKNIETNNDDDSEINGKNNINNEGKELNSNDININVDENDENKKEKEIIENKIEEKKSESNDNNANTNNEIKEETSFNLSDNTD